MTTSTASNGHFIHQTIEGDRWDLLAYKYYGDAAKQSIILTANRNLFLDPVRMPPMILTSGLNLIIPVIDADEINQSDLPPWKRKDGGYD